ncbi:MAG: hypothetical protein ACOZNI_17405 [Myxococcota bacterium]
MRTLFLLALLLPACDNPGGKDDGTGAGGDDTASGTGGGGTATEQPDADGDSIIDVHDGEDDADGDGKPNYDDKDSDGDSIYDANEAGDDDPLTMPVDTDGDGVADYVDSDSDGNCVGDEIEAGRDDGGAEDSDDDGTKDFQDFDNDGDGIPDLEEIDDCAATDTDGDSTADYMDADSDNDGIGDAFEGGTSTFSDEPVDSDEDGTPDFRDTDSDNDGLLDADEGGTNGNEASEPRDTDGDGRADYADTDADGDSLPDADEIALGTDPYDNDSDGDGFTDGGEVTAGTDPLDAASVIDGIYVEVPERTTVEEEFDFELHIEMGDIGFIIDTTCSMGGTISAISSEFATIVTELDSVLPDTAYGVGGHDDYAYGSYGSAGIDKPFYLRQQITTELTDVQTALNGLSTHSGADGPESGTEALYQAASGAGYDQTCNGTYDAQTDTPPFISGSEADIFAGGSSTEYYDSSTVDGGTLGGFGFRDYALPVIVLAGDNYLRDPESSNSYYNGVPPAACFNAGMSDAELAFTDLGALFVGVSVNGTLGYPQMESFAQNIGSYVDSDGDGVAAEVPVETWSGSNAAFREAIVDAITQLVAAIRFSRVDLAVDGDTYGFVAGIEPAYYEGLGSDDEGAVLNFTLTFRGVVAATNEDQLYRLTLNVLGDSSILLDSLDIIVVVPGTAY